VRMAFVGKAYPSVREVAVSWSGAGAYLWRVTDGKAERVIVKLVRRENGRILVDGPLGEGDLIVIEGVQGLREGQKLDAKPIGGGKSDGDKISGADKPKKSGKGTKSSTKENG
jgi:hypothetical protein